MELQELVSALPRHQNWVEALIFPPLPWAPGVSRYIAALLPALRLLVFQVVIGWQADRPTPIRQQQLVVVKRSQLQEPTPHRARTQLLLQREFCESRRMLILEVAKMLPRRLPRPNQKLGTQQTRANKNVFSGAP